MLNPENSMKTHRNLTRNLALYAVTDRSWTGRQTLLEQIESALIGGVTFLQLREKELTSELFIQEALKVKELCDSFNVPLVINDNVQVALAVNASGVHLGQGDMSVFEARKVLGPDKIIGVSAHSVVEAINAEKAGVNYIGIGAVFTTQTKSDATLISIEELIGICHSVSIPAVGIGGISFDNIEFLRNTGIAGVAVISAIFAQPDIEMATLALRERVKNIIGN